MENYYHTYDQANGKATVYNVNKVNGGGWYVKRHYRTQNGERIGYWYSIHRARKQK